MNWQRKLMVIKTSQTKLETKCFATVTNPVTVAQNQYKSKAILNKIRNIMNTHPKFQSLVCLLYLTVKWK